MGKKSFTYEEVKFWNSKKIPIPKRELTEKEVNMPVNFIKENLVGCKKVLDFGPGKGRTFGAYEEIETVRAYDISDTWKSYVFNSVKKYNIKNFDLIISKKIESLPYKDNEFDAVVVSLVLLHQRPQYIINVMSELVRVSKKVIAISYYSKLKDFILPGTILDNSKAKKHNYNYKKICEDNKWFYKEILHRLDFHNHLYFIFSGKKI